MNPIGVRKADQPETVSKRMKPEQEEPEEAGVKLNDLPELPFELILSYLSLEDRIKSRAVSRRWYNVINSFEAKSLCFSMYPSDFITYNSRWVSGAFAQNFINSTKFVQFFQTFGQSILTNLKHLRLCQLDLITENTPASFFQILNSFGRLEKLDLFDIAPLSELGRDLQVRLNLPMLKSFQLDEVSEIRKLSLDAPKLQNVKLANFSKVELVHGESVEKLIIDRLDKMEVNKLKNLKYLYCGEYSRIDSTLLSTLEHLVEIHLNAKKSVADLFQQKAQYRRSNLKIFLFGYHLDGPSDPAIGSLHYRNKRSLAYLAEHSSRLAEEIPLRKRLQYSTIEAVAPGLEIDLLKRFTDLGGIDVYRPVQDVERLLKLLNNFDNIGELFFDSDQQQELFDRLPGHCTIQSLDMINAPADLNFLLGLKSLIHLVLFFSIDIEFISRVLEELPFLLDFEFKYLNEYFEIEIYRRQFTIRLRGKGGEETTVYDVNAVVQWISEKATKEEESEYEVSEDEESEDEE